MRQLKMPLLLVALVAVSAVISALISGADQPELTMKASTAGLLGITMPSPRDMLDEIVYAQRVNLLADGQRRSVWTSARTVEEAVRDAGITVGPRDRTEPDAGDPVVDNMEIGLVRVEQRAVQEEVVVPYRTVRVPSRALMRGQERETTHGVNGKLLKTYEVILEDGVEISRELVSTVELIQKRDRVVEEGIIATLSRGGRTFRYSKELIVNASAYTSDIDPATGLPDDPWAGKTSSGKPAEAGKTIAVDPRVIPMGSLVYVEGLDAVGKKYSGVYEAMDTGSAIKGNKIDIYMSTFSECVAFGRRNMKVYLLEP